MPGFVSPDSNIWLLVVDLKRCYKNLAKEFSPNASLEDELRNSFWDKEASSLQKYFQSLQD